MKLFAFIVFSGGIAGPSIAARSLRQATIEWKALRGIRTYEVEIGKNARLDPLLFKVRSPQSVAKIRVAPGAYFFRIRALHKGSVPGPWSEVQGFVVNPRPPQPRAPEDAKRFGVVTERGIRFEWERGIAGSQYFFELRDPQGVVITRGLDRNHFDWKPKSGGRYTWRVGYGSLAGSEWSRPRELWIDPGAFPDARVALRSPSSIATNCAEIDWGSIQVNGIWAWEKFQGKLMTGQLNWNPNCALTPAVGLRANLGTAVLKDNADNLVVAIESSIFLSFRPYFSRPFTLEVGSGFQTWLPYGAYPGIGGNIVLEEKGTINRYFIGYSALIGPTDWIHLIKFGVGFHFGT